MQKILLAVDGSLASKRAAEKTAEIAEFIDSDVTILTVMEVQDIKLREVEAYIPEKTIEELREINKKEMNKKGKEILEGADEYFKNKDIKTKKIIKYGDPADVICDFAEEKEVDLIVLADKGLGGVKRFFLGSISGKVVRHAKSSVMIIK